MFPVKLKLILSTAFLALIGACSNETKKDASSTVSNEQPQMVITMIDSTTVNLHDLKGKNVLIFFQPDCDHCQHEAEEIKKNQEAFASSTLYFITAAPLDEIQKFADEYKLSGIANIHFAFTPARNILDNYGPIEAPSIYIYSEEQRLVKSFNGQVAVEKVLKFI